MMNIGKYLAALGHDLRCTTNLNSSQGVLKGWNSAVETCPYVDANGNKDASLLDAAMATVEAKVQTADIKATLVAELSATDIELPRTTEDIMTAQILSGYKFPQVTQDKYNKKKLLRAKVLGVEVFALNCSKREYHKVTCESVDTLTIFLSSELKTINAEPCAVCNPTIDKIN